MQEFSIPNEAEMVALGGRLANGLQGGEVIYLQGELGAGKTTLVRGVLIALGHNGNVKSPTYTLIEPYSLSGKNIYHFDLYRINDPEELEAMGIRDYCEPDSICLFEWPERGQEALPSADLRLSLSHAEPGREVEIEAISPIGQSCLEKL